MEMAGIYKIENLVNGKVYIGRAKSLSRRWAIHKCDLNKGNHVNKHLQASFNKYGDNVFDYSAIEELFPSVDYNEQRKKRLKEREQYWAYFYDAFDCNKGYNMYPITEGGRMSPETRKRLSKANRGEKNSNAKITENDAVQICKRINSGYILKDIAREFGVSIVTIQKIYHGVTWKHISKLYLTPNTRVNKKIPPECIIDIYECICKGVPEKENAALHNVSRFVVLQIRHGNTHQKLIEQYLENKNEES